MANVQKNIKLPVDATHMSSSINSLDIIIQLEKSVEKNYTGLGTAIRHAIKNHTPANTIIKDLKEMAQDNRPMMVSVIGESLTSKILAS